MDSGEGVFPQLEIADDVSGHAVTRRRNGGPALAAFQMSQDLGSIERPTGVTADTRTRLRPHRRLGLIPVRRRRRTESDLRLLPEGCRVRSRMAHRVIVGRMARGPSAADGDVGGRWLWPR